MEGSKARGETAVAQVVKARRGQWSLMGRYHCHPRKLEDDYYLRDEVLGRGASGVVLLAHSRLAPTESFAVKRLRLSNVRASERADFLSEAKTYLCMDHPHVARLVNVYESPERIDLVMERCTGGTLQERMEELGRFPEQCASRAARQVLLALSYLHAQGVVHRDLKMENCMYETPDSDHLKLIDFGLSKYLGRLVSLRRMTSECGTLSYAAPEVLNKAYTCKAESWSLGVIVFALLSGSMPFDGSTAAETVKAIKGAKYQLGGDPWKSLSEHAADFVSQMLCKDPERRLTANEALQHPWIVAHYHHRSDPKLLQALPSLRTMSDSRKCCFAAMSWSLRAEDVHAVRQEFLAMDVHAQGTITISDLRKFIGERGGADEGMVRQVFESFDINGDNEIDYSEFLALMMGHEIIEVPESAIRAAFRNFDEDLSGYITQGDLERVVPRRLHGSAWKALLREAHPKRDGQVSFRDFRNFVRTTSSETHDPGTLEATPSFRSESSMSSGGSGLFCRSISRTTSLGVVVSVPSSCTPDLVSLDGPKWQSQQRACCVCM